MSTASKNGSERYWEKRYADGFTSGSGSYGQLADFKSEVIQMIIKKNSISSVIELGCGDGNQVSITFPKNLRGIKYLGLDVSKTAIDICCYKFSDDNNKDFILIDTMHFSNKQKIISAEMSISLDVIYHLVEDPIFEKYMDNLFSLATKLVLIYSADDDRPDDIAPHVRRRKVTEYIRGKYTEWELVEHIPNKYPYIVDDPNTSFSDFYVYVNKYFL